MQPVAPSSPPDIPLVIRPVDPSSPTDLAQLNALDVACDRARYGASEVTTPEQRAVRLAPETDYWVQQHWVAGTESLEGGTAVVGIAALQLPRRENLEAAFVGLDVHPAYVGHGVGTALLAEAVVPAVRESGRTLVTCWGDVPADGELDDPAVPANRLAARFGLHRTSAAVCRVLELPLDPELLDGLAAEASEKMGTYHVLTWSDEIPEEHLAAYGRLLTQLEIDDPDEDTEYDAPDYTPERVRYMEGRRRKLGQRAIIAVAVAPDGTFAGNSEILFQDDPGTDLGWQENTLVMPDHRGHRLGLALKVSTHRRLAAEAPGLRRLVTWNSHVNPWMIAINEKLGYRVQYRAITYQGRAGEGHVGEGEAESQG